MVFIIIWFFSCIINERVRIVLVDVRSVENRLVEYDHFCILVMIKSKLAHFD